MNKTTNLNVGFIVICPDPNLGSIKSTTTSLSSNYSDIPISVVVPVGTSKEITKIAESYSNVIVGQKSLLSLVNSGIEQSPTPWNMVLHQGTLINKGVIARLCRPVTSEKDVVYAISPIFDRSGRPTHLRSEFAEAVLNGTLLHKSALKIVGQFTDNPIEISKFYWMLDAINQGFSFKGVLGARIF